MQVLLNTVVVELCVSVTFVVLSEQVNVAPSSPEYTVKEMEDIIPFGWLPTHVNESIISSSNKKHNRNRTYYCIQARTSLLMTNIWYYARKGYSISNTNLASVKLAPSTSTSRGADPPNII